MFAGVRTALLSGVVKEVKEEILTFVYRKTFRSGVNNFL
jgi:hypothetical protein